MLWERKYVFITYTCYKDITLQGRGNKKKLIYDETADTRIYFTNIPSM